MSIAAPGDCSASFDASPFAPAHSAPPRNFKGACPLTAYCGAPPQPIEEMSMNWDRIEGNWAQFKGKVQQQWGKLTDDDFDVIEGKRKELAGKIQERYGYEKDKAEAEIDDWLKNVRH
jgi:uncharacterized protein YjbJ (UPF0337 family)